jgi:transposase-like protein
MHMRRVVDEGGSVASAAAELRIPKHTLYNWRDIAEGRRKKRSRPAKAGWKPVTVVATPVVDVVKAPSVVVLGPRGLRVEGLGLTAVAELWRALD